MRIIYTHENRSIVENARNVLLINGVEVVLKNEFSSGGQGELSAIDTWPELWVNLEDYAKAKQLIDGLLAESQSEGWLCQACSERNEASFEFCWKCQHDRAQF